jgi:hypothetical protein
MTRGHHSRFKKARFLKSKQKETARYELLRSAMSKNKMLVLHHLSK